MISIVKGCSDAKWNPKEKAWTVKKTERTRYSLEEILPKTDEFTKYFNPLPKQSLLPKYDILWPPQRRFAESILHLKRVIGAIEMRAGKTLAVFAAVDTIKPKSYYWFASKSALRSLRIQLNTWRPYRTPDIIDSYSNLKKYKSPQVVVFDESMALKTPTSKRTKEAMRIADGAEYVILLTGTPAPQNFLDWWAQCEVCRPGLVKEKNHFKFIERYAIVDPLYFKPEAWIPEETSQFPKRVGNLIHTYYRKDLGKVFNVTFTRVRIPTQVEHLDQATEMLDNGTPLQVLSSLRQLSDGFLYTKKVSICSCVPPCCANRDVCFDEEIPYCRSCMQKFYLTSCPTCKGAGLKETRQSEFVHSRKLKEIEKIISDLRRVVVYAAFTESLNRITDFFKNLGWDVIRIDGKGMQGGCLEDFDMFVPGRTAVVAHPACGGEGIDLSASETIIYYSNTFKASERWQSQDRCLSPGNSVTIYDLIYLPTDEQVLDNLQQKRAAQEITLESIRSRILKASAE